LGVINPLCDTLFDLPRKAVFRELKRGEGKEGWIVFEEVSQSPELGRKATLNTGKEIVAGGEWDKARRGMELPPVPPTPRRVRLPPSPPSVLPRIEHVLPSAAQQEPFRQQRPIDKLKITERPTQQLLSTERPNPTSQDDRQESTITTIPLDPTLPGGQFPRQSQPVAHQPEKGNTKGLSFLKPLFLSKKSKDKLPDPSPLPEPKKLDVVEETGEASYDIIDLYDLDQADSRGRYPTFPTTDISVAGTTKVDTLRLGMAESTMVKEKAVEFGDVQVKARSRRTERARDPQDEAQASINTLGMQGKGSGDLVVEVDEGVHSRIEGRKGVVPEAQAREPGKSDGVLSEYPEEGHEKASVPEEEHNSYDMNITGSGPSTPNTATSTSSDNLSTTISSHTASPPPTPFLVKAFEDLPFSLDVSSVSPLPLPRCD
jgi:hypothetical protein